jgi:hypothetical protein
MRTKKEKKPFLLRYKTYDPSVEGYGNVNQWRSAWEGMSFDEAKETTDEPLTVLGFTSIPSRSELDKRFRELVKKHHPDHGGDPIMFKKVHAAWVLLKDRTI